MRTRFILNNFFSVGLDWGGPRTPPPLGYAHDGIIIIRSILGLPLLPAAHIPTALQEIHATICNDNVM